MRTKQKLLAVCLVCTVIWVTAGLLIASVAVLSLVHVGFHYSIYSISVDTTTLYQPGRYFLGLGRSFIEFPSDVQIIIFSDTLREEKLRDRGFSETAKFYPTIQARSSEGLPVGIDLVIFYQLGYQDSALPSLPVQFYQLFQQLDHDFDSLVSSVAIYELTNLISQYSALDIVLQRKTIGSIYKQNLKSTLRTDFILINSANLLNINQSSLYEDAVETSVITSLNITYAQYELQAAQITSNTNLQLAQKQANMTIEKAKADALISNVYSMAIANATASMLNSQMNAFSQLAINLGLTDDFMFSRAEKMLNFYWIFLQINNSLLSNRSYFSSMKTFQLNQFE